MSVENQSWDGPFWCGGNAGQTHCDKPEPHLHCDGPVKGDVVTYESRLGSGEAVVKTHWHYDGCMLDVEGLSRSLSPDLGDKVTVKEKAE